MKLKDALKKGLKKVYVWEKNDDDEMTEEFEVHLEQENDEWEDELAIREIETIYEALSELDSDVLVDLLRFFVDENKVLTEDDIIREFNTYEDEIVKSNGKIYLIEFNNR